MSRYCAKRTLLKVARVLLGQSVLLYPSSVTSLCVVKQPEILGLPTPLERHMKPHAERRVQRLMERLMERQAILSGQWHFQ